MTLQDKFFYLLRLGLGGIATEPLSVSHEEWEELYKMGEEHTLLGIIFAAIDKVSEEQMPRFDLLRKWIGLAGQISKRNKSLNAKCQQLTEKLKDAGLDSCVLKGQGLSKLYDRIEGSGEGQAGKISMLRQPGDIDLWCKSSSLEIGRNIDCRGKDIGSRSKDIDRSVKDIKQILENISAGTVGKATYYHVEWKYEGVEVEVHYRPLAFFNPINNRRFQRWCESQWSGRTITSDGFYVPSFEFNAIYLLAHLYHHLLFEGVGLRQVCDYFVLLSTNTEHIPTERIATTIRSLGMMRFARGMMWVMGEILKLDRSKMLVEPDATEGRFILSEILQAGNFGQADKRIDHSKESSTTGKFYVRTKHRMRFLFRYPSEILCDIPYRFYHWYWRRRFA